MRLDPKFQPLLQAQLKLWQGSAELWQNQAAHWAELDLQLLRKHLDDNRQATLQWLEAADVQRPGLLLRQFQQRRRHGYAGLRSGTVLPSTPCRQRWLW